MRISAPLSALELAKFIVAFQVVRVDKILECELHVCGTNILWALAILSISVDLSICCCVVKNETTRKRGGRGRDALYLHDSILGGLLLQSQGGECAGSVKFINNTKHDKIRWFQQPP